MQWGNSRKVEKVKHITAQSRDDLFRQEDEDKAEEAAELD